MMKDVNFPECKDMNISIVVSVVLPPGWQAVVMGLDGSDASRPLI